MKDRRIGVVLPTRETVMTGRHDLAGLLALATDAERLGYDSVWAGDSLLARPRFEPLTLLAAVAAVTSTVHIGTAALIPQLRHPLALAHGIATVDRAAAGRLVLGLGSGAPTPETRAEFEAVGVPFDGRIARMDEAVGHWRAAWAGWSDGVGARPEAERSGVDRLPPPYRPGGPPMWLAGGDSPRVLRRAGAHYDGWLPYLADPDRYAAAWDAVRASATVAGRDPDALTPGAYLTVNLNPDAAAARAELDDYCRRYYFQPLEVIERIQGFFGGPVDDCLAWLTRYTAAGARHVVLRFGTLDPEPQVRQAAETLLPALRAA